jgi:hypothetical protein
MDRRNYPRSLRKPTERSYPSMPHVNCVRQIQLRGNRPIWGSWGRGNYSKKDCWTTQGKGHILTELSGQITHLFE